MNVLNVVLSVILSVVISYITISNISNEKLNTKTFLIYAIILIPLFIMTCLFFNGIIKILINILFTIIALYLSIFNKDITNSVYYTFVYNIFSAIIEILLSLLFVGVLKYDINVYNNFSFSLLIFSFCNSFFVYLIFKIKFLNIAINKFKTIISKNNREWAYLSIVIVLIILIITFNRYNLTANINFYINVFITIFIIRFKNQHMKINIMK